MTLATNARRAALAAALTLLPLSAYSEPGTQPNPGPSTVTLADWEPSRLIGKSLYGPDRYFIGVIDAVTRDDQGKVTAVVVDAGGATGIGARPVALGDAELQVITEPAGTIYFRSLRPMSQLQALPVQAR